MSNYYGFYLRDEDFIRGNIPMTKEEVRVISLSKLELREDSTVVDIGAGTGSISIACSLISKCGKVYAVETVKEGIDLIIKNKEKFNVNNLIPIHGMAPEALEGIEKVDRIIIGGSRGNILKIIHWSKEHLTKDGIIVANFITIENLFYFLDGLKENNFDYEVTQVSISKGNRLKNITMMQGLNPVFIVKAFLK